MWVTGYKVHCGRKFNGSYSATSQDWLKWSIPFQEFSGLNTKRDASIFVSIAQAKGAIKQHKKTRQSRGKYTIHAVKVQVKRAK